MTARTDLLYLAAVVVILFKAWQGWRLGLVRQVVSLLALVIAALCGWFAGAPVGALLAPLLPVPERILAMIGGLLLGLSVFGVISVLSAILFRKTSDQGVTIVRVGYGLSGAALGAVYGVILVCAFAVALRLLGSIAETKLAIEKNPRLPGARQSGADVVMPQFAALKHALEQGAVGAVLQRLDPLPPATYTTLTKLAKLVSNTHHLERLLAYPGVQPVLDHPKVAALLRDPEVSKALAERRYFALLSNPHLVAAADDPEVAARLAAIDLDEALDYALRR